MINDTNDTVLIEIDNSDKVGNELWKLAQFFFVREFQRTFFTNLFNYSFLFDSSLNSCPGSIYL